VWTEDCIFPGRDANLVDSWNQDDSLSNLHLTVSLPFPSEFEPPFTPTAWFPESADLESVSPGGAHSGYNRE
jgi:hypothetical protein